MAGTPRVYRSDQVMLAALMSAPRCGRLFVRHVCTGWQVSDEQIETAELLASELVSNAVQATGILLSYPDYGTVHAHAKLVGIRLREFAQSMVIEVWDASPEPPKRIEPDVYEEHGRGLRLVERLSIRWGFYCARLGGKVVWCELGLASEARNEWDREPATLQRVLEGLQALKRGSGAA